MTRPGLQKQVDTDTVHYPRLSVLIRVDPWLAMKTRARSFTWVAAAAAALCSVLCAAGLWFGPVGVVPRLAVARAGWEAQGPRSYRMTARWTYGTIVNGPWTIDVRDHAHWRAADPRRAAAGRAQPAGIGAVRRAGGRAAPDRRELAAHPAGSFARADLPGGQGSDRPLRRAAAERRVPPRARLPYRHHRPRLPLLPRQ
jgi:hypothetical protein